MLITIHYSAQARSLTGKASETVELDAPRPVGEVLLRLVDKHAALRRLLLGDDGSPHPSLLLFVGDEQVQPRGDRLLQAGEVLTILPPIAGG